MVNNNLFKIADDVLRDCVRSKEKGKKPEVHGRLCLFDNGKSVLEVGQTIEQVSEHPWSEQSSVCELFSTFLEPF